MTFIEKYYALETEFKQRVKTDNDEFGIESGYAHNFIPEGPVDYILIAMEPSTGVPGTKSKNPSQSDHDQVERNFTWSVEDFILHHCIRKWLCRDGETYHLTDLAKGGMKVKLAGKKRKLRYKRWYPLLEKELDLLNKPGKTRIIAIGKVVVDFLADKPLCDRVERILHYSPSNQFHWNKGIETWREQFSEFSSSVADNTLDATIEQVLIAADMSSYIGCRPPGHKRNRLTESRKKLMFYYKNKFRILRDAPRIVLNR